MDKLALFEEDGCLIPARPNNFVGTFLNEWRAQHLKLWKIVEPTHMFQDDTHKSIRELHLSFHSID